MRRRTVLALIVLAPSGAWAADDGKKKKSGGLNYIPINPITGTTNKSGGRRGVLSVDCGLEVDDPKLRDYAEKSLPRLRAAYEQVIQIYAAGLPSGSEPNTEFIVQALQRQTDLILKQPGARFLVGAVVVS
ncbi:MAG TPA: Tat pathway signal protein [Phenylobacterium sp.]|nr:Tat pathway signal protein [Phenylobacterium sp.]